MEQQIEQFKRVNPKAIFITPDIENVTHYLDQVQFLRPEEEVRKVQKPGEGNMNFVLRVVTDQRQFVLKQARPWVEKYPGIPAPVERNFIEASFYKKISSNTSLQQYSPDILFTDTNSNVFLMSDLGEGSDYMHLYEPRQLLEEDSMRRLMQYLTELHQISASEFHENLAMRRLNHEHIFRFPFVQDNGFDLNLVQSGLADLSQKYKSNRELTSKIFALGKRYLEKGTHLVHGDYYPGCWLFTNDGLKIIDPEFCFPGFPEFDLGIMAGHLLLSGQPKHYLERMVNFYGLEVNDHLMFQIGGVSVLRRILGVAQLPLKYTLEEKEQLMDQATQWIVS